MVLEPISEVIDPELLEKFEETLQLLLAEA